MSLSGLAAFDVLRQLVESLIAEFDRAEADPRFALSLRWMQRCNCRKVMTVFASLCSST